MDFRNLIEGLQPPRTLADYVTDIARKPVFIYGAGCFGRELYGVFVRHDIRPMGFLDRRAIEISDAPAPVYAPEDVADKDQYCVVIGIVMDKPSRIALESYLGSIGFSHVVDGQSIRAHYVYALGEAGERHPSVYYRAVSSEIEAARTLLADAESIDTYERCLRAHFLRDYTDCPQTDASTQYFDADVPLTKGFGRFVDCGAYIGDTLQELCRRQRVEEVAAFEPDAENFARLSRVFDEELHERIDRAVLFPCGVAAGASVRSFAPAGGSGAITDEGSVRIQTVALDQALKGFVPTFIKMDIEGAEFEALHGARRTITAYAPDLAVCVYHIIDDFYRIPLLIRRWHPHYRFFLRSHSSCCMETVLYATEGN